MNGILAVVQANIEVIMLLILGLSLISIILVLMNFLRTIRVINRYNSLMKGYDGKNLEQMLAAHIETVDRVAAKNFEMENANRALRKMAEFSIQNVGVVRFNAFDDTGSDLSFAVALLDYHGDGLVISSLFGRNETRTYAKPVSKGTSSYHLSNEEEEAIRKALKRQIVK